MIGLHCIEMIWNIQIIIIAVSTVACLSYGDKPDGFKSIIKKYDECRLENYKEFNETWRFHERKSFKFVREDDTKIEHGWYRFINGSFRMLEQSELFQDVLRDRTTFTPSGARQFQAFEFSPFPPKLFEGTTPLYVLDTTHPDIPGESIETTSSECYYRTVLNVFGPSEGITRQCKRDDPERRNCVFYHFCKEEKINVTVRHCGSHYVYKLKPVRVLKSNKFFDIPKSGLYCGTKNNTMPEPRAPCICQVKNDVQEIRTQTKCEINYKSDDQKVMKAITNCLTRERKLILRELKSSTKCHIRLNKALWKKGKKFTMDNLKAQIQLCVNVKRDFHKGVYNRLALTRQFSSSKRKGRKY